MSHLNGVAPGTVEEIDNKLGRLRVKLPWLSEENKTYWARVATLMAGNGLGAWFMPQIGDEVLLGFEMGDIEHPYVLGFLWSEKDKPPVKDDAIDEKVRRFRSVKEHRLDFDDRDSKERIFVQSHSKHTLEMNDTSSAFVEVKTNGKRSMRLDDQKSTITVQTAADPMIELNDATPKITLQVAKPDPSVVLDGMAGSVTITVGTNVVTVDRSGVSITAVGALNLKGTTVSIVADGPLTLQGALVSLTPSSILSVSAPLSSFAGVVQATGIISPTYTPGIGNLI